MKGTVKPLVYFDNDLYWSGNLPISGEQGNWESTSQNDPRRQARSPRVCWAGIYPPLAFWLSTQMWEVWGCLHLVPDCLPTPEAVLRDLLYLPLLTDCNLGRLYLNAKLQHRVSLHFLCGCSGIITHQWSGYIKMYSVVSQLGRLSSATNLNLVMYSTMELLNQMLLVYHNMQWNPPLSILWTLPLYLSILPQKRHLYWENIKTMI